MSYPEIQGWTRTVGLLNGRACVSYSRTSLGLHAAFGVYTDEDELAFVRCLQAASGYGPVELIPRKSFVYSGSVQDMVKQIRSFLDANRHDFRSYW